MSSSRVNLEKYLIPLEEINRATQNFSEERRIGDGGFGAVYKGQLSERWENCTAAIKRLSRDSYQGEQISQIPNCIQRLPVPPYYLDPTYQESRILQKTSDVYSFGVVLFEILSGMLAYRERSIVNERQFLIHSVRRYHLKDPDMIIDPHIIDEIDYRSFDIFKNIAFQCISFNLEERPSLETVIEKIEEALTVQVSLFIQFNQ
ncbi:hypothetical protein L1887_18325 [Cichorium endivia]|nr:hypothetical protein L1887_18325 [Cichorium endivia]